jgi:hypothetical protein
MLRQRVELNLGTPAKLDPVTHLAGPRPEGAEPRSAIPALRRATGPLNTRERVLSRIALPEPAIRSRR